MGEEKLEDWSLRIQGIPQQQIEGARIMSEEASEQAERTVHFIFPQVCSS
jgi:hypothetical protein